jgi:hypothetical protein
MIVYDTKKIDKFNGIKYFWFERWLFEKKEISSWWKISASLVIFVPWSALFASYQQTNSVCFSQFRKSISWPAKHNAIQWLVCTSCLLTEPMGSKKCKKNRSWEGLTKVMIIARYITHVTEPFIIQPLCQLISVKPVDRVRKSADICCPVSDQSILIRVMDLPSHIQKQCNK